MDEKIIINRKHYVIWEYIFAMTVVAFAIYILVTITTSMFLLIGLFIILAGFIHSLFSSSQYISIYDNKIVIKYYFIQNRVLDFNLSEIAEVKLHRSYGRLDRNHFTLLFTNKNTKKQIYFDANSKEYNRLKNEFITQNLKVYEDE